MNTNKNIIKGAVLLVCVVMLIVAGCKKNDYYLDSGVVNPKFNGNMMEYLESKPFNFDTLSAVIKLAGMEDVFKNENITFFAPQDPSIALSIKSLNTYLSSSGKDSVKRLSDIKPNAWREILSMYVFKGSNRLKDYRQVDTLALDTYAGQGYLSYNQKTLNIGVIFNDAVNGNVIIKYAGYRQLMISYIPDLSNPKSKWINSPVSSSDINPTNGIVHAVKYTNHAFGFDVKRFILIAMENGIGN